MIARALILATALAAGGCAFVPKDNLRIDEAAREYRAALADPAVSRLAADELRSARDILDEAIRARDTLQDVGEADHLAYLARQRVAISREAALQRSLAAPAN